MKQIEIIIPSARLTDVHNVLKGLNVGGMSHYEIEGTGKIKVDPVVAATHPTQTQPEYIPRQKVEVVVKDQQVEQLISRLRERLSYDPQGGKIFVTDVPIAVDIASNKRGEDAI
jgi:nitrogen regulatory protein P-II 1